MKEIYQDSIRGVNFGDINPLYHVVKGRAQKKKIQKRVYATQTHSKKIPNESSDCPFHRSQRQTDLVDFGSLQKFYQGYHYLLKIIYILSKHAYVIPNTIKVKDKVKPFQTIFTYRKQKLLQSNARSQYRNKLSRKFFTQERVWFLTTFNNTEVSIEERFNRTLKTKIRKYFTYYHT